MERQIQILTAISYPTPQPPQKILKVKILSGTSNTSDLSKVKKSVHKLSTA
jgi:hypothetical protein